MLKALSWQCGVDSSATVTDCNLKVKQTPQFAAVLIRTSFTLNWNPRACCRDG